MDDKPILQSVKDYLGITEEIKDFDVILINHINATFAYFTQLGLGPEGGFSISGPNETWGSYIKNPIFNDVPSLMGARVKQAFDPPPTGAVSHSLDRVISELEWRITAKQEVHPW